MQLVLVVVLDPAANQLTCPWKVAKVVISQRFARAAMKPFQRPVRFRVIRANPNMLQFELPHQGLEIGRRKLRAVVTDDLHIRQPVGLERMLNDQPDVRRLASMSAAPSARRSG